MTRFSLLLAALALPAAPAAAADCKLGVMADLPVTMQGMRASVPVKINGKDARFWLDGGASSSIMPHSKAVEFGLKTSPAPFGLRLVGIGRDIPVDIVTVKSFGIADKVLDNIQFLVGGIAIDNGVIGRNLLSVGDTEFDLAGGSVKLIKPVGDCEHVALAYWAAGKPFFTAALEEGDNPLNHRFGVTVRINGAEIKAEYGGVSNTFLSRRAAEKAHLNLRDLSAVPISGNLKPRWSVAIDRVEIGNETVLKTRLDVIDGPISMSADGPDMLIGTDYLLAHHIYIARNQHRIYFTYSGGKPFLSSDTTTVSTATTGAPLPANIQRVSPMTNDTALPKTAEEFARRANARLAQRAFADAIADFTKAVTLAPDNAGHYRDRALAYQISDQDGLARADIESALRHAPADGALLRIRANLRLRDRDRAGALADAEAAVGFTPPASLDMLPIAGLFADLDQPARGIALLGPVIDSYKEDFALAGLLNARCWMRARANLDLALALADCNRALKLAGKTPHFLDSRGLVYLRMSNAAAAILDYNAALAINPKLAWSLYGRGLAKIALGQKDAGTADKAAAVAIFPGIGEEAKWLGGQ